MRYFITLSYDGGRYHGWQVQPNGDTVQAQMERAVSTLLRRETIVVGAGRTDAGVHARKMVAHFDTDQPVDCAQMAHKLNGLLPRDIAVSRVEPVDEAMHARFSATLRTYRYYVHRRKSPFVRDYSCELHYELDFELMNRAAQMLIGEGDYAAFCKAGSDVKTTICSVTEARWVQTGEHEWHFVISANRFLRNMVRAVVGTLIEVGRGRMTLDEFRLVLQGGSRSMAGESMPARALFLEDVQY